jgi:rubrerythrin
MAERVGRCKRCKMQLPVEDLRLDKDMKSWVCRACLQGVPMTQRARGVGAVVDDHFKRKEKDFKDQATYKCSCGYVFSREKDKKVVRCPYCGREPSAFKKEVSAQDLVETAEGYDF